MAAVDYETMRLQRTRQHSFKTLPGRQSSIGLNDSAVMRSVERINLYLTVATEMPDARWYHDRVSALETLPREIRQRIFVYTLPDGALTARTDLKKLEAVVSILEALTSMSRAIAGDVPYICDRVLTVVKKQIQLEMTAVKAIVTGTDAQNMPVLDTFGWFERYRQACDIQCLITPLETTINEHRNDL